MKTIAIFARKFGSQHRNSLQSILSSIEKAGGKVLIYKQLHNHISRDFAIRNFAGTFENHEELKESADFLISLGGDGTLLEAVTYVRNSNIPILGVNIGRLGFLSNIDVLDIQTAINALFENHFVSTERTLLRLRSISEMALPEPPFAINDITISKKDTNSMIVIHVTVNDIVLNSYWADGLIISTPTGSTAYSLSCAGPILTPDSQNFVLTPIAPHNLSVRPVVLPENSIIKCIVDGRSRSFHLTLDSKTISIKTGSEIIVEKEQFTVKLINLPGDHFFQIIRDKLHWGSDIRN
jgi:NAD+ kinase